MDVKYQVFVSSTFVDLQDERRAVIESILNMGHIPVGMEAFQASDDTQWEYIKRRIDESDYYVVIVGERYGSEQKGKSYTQMEYEYAVSRGVPVSAFLLHEEKRKIWPSDKVEYEKRDKIEKFRKLCQKKLVKFWKNSDDLGAKIAATLYELMREKPRTGWVRGDAMPSKMVLEELSRLSEEKRLLQAKVNELSQTTADLVIPANAVWLVNELKSKRISQYCTGHDFEPVIDTDMMTVFGELHKYFAKGYDIFLAHHQLVNYFNTKNPHDNRLNQVIGEIYSDFLIANLIETSIVQTYFFEKPHSNEVYRLTEYGKQFVMYSKEIERRNLLGPVDKVWQPYLCGGQGEKC